jgi:hypothetical protein
MAKRIPNRLKFSFVSSDTAKIEGTLGCSDEAWNKIFAILMDEIAARKADRDAATHTTEGGSNG